jgi:cytochrome c oxidase subunit III
MEPPADLDVSHLPPLAFGNRSPFWWGNMMFIVIETTTLALLVVSYFYTRQNFDDWPPPRANEGVLTSNPLPELALATVDLVLMIGSFLPMTWTDRAARRGDGLAVKKGLLLLSGVGVVAIVLRVYEFQGLKFRWDDNAYASHVWAILFMHLTYLLVTTLEVIVDLVWILIYGMDLNLADDVTLTVLYWYWVAGIWVPLYAVVFWAPRLL